MRIGLHYSFQVAPGERPDAVIRAGLEDIRWADANGFSAVVFASHHFFEDCWIPRPIQMATAAAAVTRNVRVGTDIIILPLHHPVAVAEEAAFCDNISGGRFILGVGLGWQEGEYRGFGVPYRQRARIYERSLGIVRGLLRGETVTDDEGYYRLEGARVRPPPVNPDGIPIWIGAKVEAALERVARMGDAWVMSPGLKLEHLARLQRFLKDARQAAGRPSFKNWPLRREAFVADTDDKAWDLYAPALRHEYGVVYRPLYPDYPEKDTVANLRKWGEKTFVIGAPATVAARLRDFGEALGTTEVLVRYQLPYVPRSALTACLRGLKDVMGMVADVQVGGPDSAHA
jgi:alkanesulfonate monooxygenase SsuD/methylene tetrahydromethanopterin reductase-like flavin-dependent oxidoreductase (luciferase family)